MPLCRAVFSVCLLALLLAGCSRLPLGHEVVAQATAEGQVSFDVVKIDDAVLETVLAQPKPAFRDRFKQYVPPPDLKIAVGDTVSVVIWESAENGLFGNSLTELSLPAGAGARLLGEKPPPPGAPPALPPGMTVSPELLAMLLGGTPPENLPPNIAAAAIAPGKPQTVDPRRLQQLVGVATQTGRPGTRIPDQQVGSDGAISIPYAGRIEVAGRTPEEVQHRIEELLGPKALEPQALVVVTKSETNSVSVTGEAVHNKRVPLSLGGDRLLQVIAAAGGENAPVHDTFVRLSRGGVTATVPLATLVSDPQQNIYAEPGDVLTLVRRPQTFSVFGATGKNAAVPFTSDRLSLTEALAKSGGLLDARADPSAVFLFRYEPVSLVRALGQRVATGARDGVSPVVYRLDLREAKSYLLARRFPVHDKDIIFVAEAESGPVYRFFQALSRITGPIVTGVAVCQASKC